MKRNFETIGDRPLDGRERRLVESVAAALAAYFGTRQTEKHTAMALELLKKKGVVYHRPEPEIETLVG
jgi:hypothetical protein